MYSRNYVDVHCHIIHPDFTGEEDMIAQKCLNSGIEYAIVNGLEPTSNRAVIDLCSRHPHFLPAIGIYPLDAACNVITEWTADFPAPAKFNVDEEIEFIDEMARSNKIAAIGECGLDKFYLTDDTSMLEQERVLRKLMKVTDLLSSIKISVIFY